MRSFLPLTASDTPQGHAGDERRGAAGRGTLAGHIVQLELNTTPV